jgi:acetyltransferase-like isoleucine patch superfamily enzyme
MSLRSVLRSLVGRGAAYGSYRRAVMAWRRWRRGLRGVHPTAWIHASSEVRSDLRLGAYAFVSYECILMRDIEIGRYTMLAPRVAVVGVDHNFDQPGVPMFFAGRPAPRRTIIGDDCWVGLGSVVMQGVTIGRGAIIAANAVVTKDVPPYEIWGGVPARRIGARFSDPSDRAAHDRMLDGPLVAPNWPEPL